MALKELTPIKSKSISGLIDRNNIAVDANGNKFKDLQIFIDEITAKIKSGDFGLLNEEEPELAFRFKHHLDKKDKNIYGKYEIESDEYSPEAIYETPFYNADGSLNVEKTENGRKRVYVMCYIVDWSDGDQTNAPDALYALTLYEFIHNFERDWKPIEEDDIATINRKVKSNVSKDLEKIAHNSYFEGQRRELGKESARNKIKETGSDEGWKKALHENDDSPILPYGHNPLERDKYNSELTPDTLGERYSNNSADYTLLANQLKKMTRDDVIDAYKQYMMRFGIKQKVNAFKATKGRSPVTEELLVLGDGTASGRVLDLMVNGRATDMRGVEIEDNVIANSSDALMMFKKLANATGVRPKQYMQTIAVSRQSHGSTQMGIAHLISNMLVMKYPYLKFRNPTKQTSLFTKDSVDVKDLEEDVKVVDLDDDFWAVDHRGNDVVALYQNYRSGRLYAIIARDSDYSFILAAGYSLDDGTWGQGYYDFRTFDDAENFFKTQYHIPFKKLK